MALSETDPRRHKFWPSVKFLKEYVPKKLQATILFVDFAKAFDTVHKGKMELILLAYPKKPSLF